MSASGHSTGEFSAVTAAILVGGSGMRLRSTVSDRQKVLAPVRQKPFLAYLLDQLVTAGAGRVVLCCGYLGTQVRDTLGESYGSLQLVYSQEETPLGTAGALVRALPSIQSATVLVMNGDSYCQGDLVSFLHWHHRQPGRASLLLVNVDDTSRYGRVDLGSDNRVRRFEEKNAGGASGLINAGVYLIQKRLLLALSPDRAISLEHDLLPQWAAEGFLYGFKSAASFIDIGTPESYALAQGLLPE